MVDWSRESSEVYRRSLQGELERRRQAEREPSSFFGPLLWSVVLAFLFLFLITPFLTVNALSGLLYRSDAFRTTVEAIPAGAGGWLITGATLALLIAITVARRRGARRWLEDRTAPPAILIRVVVGWSFVRALVLLAGASVSLAAIGVTVLPAPDPADARSSPWDGTLLDPRAFDGPILIGMMICAVLLVTVLSSLLPLRRYRRRAERQEVADAQAASVARVQPPPGWVPPLPPPPGQVAAQPPPPQRLVGDLTPRLPEPPRPPDLPPPGAAPTPGGMS